MDEIARIQDAFSLSLWPLTASICREASAAMRGDSQALSRLCANAHRIAGTAATLGFVTLGEHAAALEDTILRAPRDPWHAHWFATFRSALHVAGQTKAAAGHLDRQGTAWTVFCVTDEPWPDEQRGVLQLKQLSSLDQLPSPPRGALVIDARVDGTSRLRKARGRWGTTQPLIAILSGESEAESLLALRAGADFLHYATEGVSPASVRLSAWAALPLPFQSAVLFIVDSDSMRASFVRAAIEPFGVRVCCEDDHRYAAKRLRTEQPHIVLVDPSNAETVALLRAERSKNPDRMLLSYGHTTWADAMIHTEPTVENMMAVLGDALRSVLGFANAWTGGLDDTKETVKIDRADLKSILPLTPRTK